VSGNITARLGAFLFPAACLGCQRRGELYLCADCRASLRPSLSLVLGAELLALGSYEGPLQACLTAVKQQGHKAVAAELALMAAQGVEQRWGRGHPAKVYSIRPSRSGQRFRGFSLPLIMERAVRERTGWVALEAALAGRFPDSKVSSQGLNLEQRLERQQRPAATPEPLSIGQGPLLILDDVVTSGATLGAAVAVARALGFEPITCCALAVAPQG
jgi:predicted amidophosphoribosyltransferase